MSGSLDHLADPDPGASGAFALHFWTSLGQHTRKSHITHGSVYEGTVKADLRNRLNFLPGDLVALAVHRNHLAENTV